MSTKGYYDPAKYPVGTRVTIATRERLREFQRTWTLHHRLTDEQMDFGGAVTMVTKTAMYHGGDVLYTLEGVPGLWHEQLLEPA